MTKFSYPKKHSTILAYGLLSLWAYLGSASSAFAAKLDPTDGCGNGINTGLGCIPFETKGFTAALLSFLIGIAGGVSILLMLIATFQIMTGGGNPEQVQKGKELFTSAITGLLFIIFSVSILRIVAGDIIQLPGF